MNYTSFGKFIKIFRIKRHEYLKEMAQKLGVSSAFLSAVETGKKRIPEDWIEKIIDLYQLSGSEKDELILSFEETNQSIKIDITDVSLVKMSVAHVFARTFEKMDDREAQVLLDFLEKEE